MGILKALVEISKDTAMKVGTSKAGIKISQKKAKLYVTAILLASAMMFGGCGKEKLLTDQEYMDYTRTELTEFMNIVQNEKFNIDDYRTIKAPVEDSKRKLEKIQKDLEGIQPPPKFVSEHAQVLIVIGNFIKRDEALLAYAKSGSNSDLAKANDYFQVGVNNMDEAPTFFTKNN